MTLSKINTNFNYQLRVLREYSECCAITLDTPIPPVLRCYYATFATSVIPIEVIGIRCGLGNGVVAPPFVNFVGDAGFPAELQTWIFLTFGIAVTVSVYEVLVAPSAPYWEVVIENSPTNFDNITTSEGVLATVNLFQEFACGTGLPIIF